MSNNLIIQFRGISKDIINRYGENHDKIATVKNTCKLISMDEPIPENCILPEEELFPEEPILLNSLPKEKLLPPEPPLITLDILEKRANNQKELDRVSKLRRYNGTLQIVNFLFSVILSLIALRFGLQFYGAENEGIFQIIYNITYLFMSPIFSLQKSVPDYGASHIEIEALIAIAFYAVIAPVISFIINICHHMDFDLV